MNGDKIKKIAMYYGFNSQCRQLMEEMAELTVALNKYHRLCDGMDNTPSCYLDVISSVDSIKEEIADVTIMIEQIKFLLDISDDDVEKISDRKLDRQIKRMEKE